MSIFGSTTFGGSRFIFWATAPFILLLMASAVYAREFDTTGKMIVFTLIEGLGGLLLLSLWPYHQIEGARRLLCGLVALAYATMLGQAAWLQYRAGDIKAGALFAAGLGFWFIGIPCIRYVVTGRFTSGPDPIEIPPGEPLMLDAYEKARATVVRLRDLHRQYPEETLIHFSLKTIDEEREHVWGEVVEIDGGKAIARLASDPVGPHGRIPDLIEVPLCELEDWAVHLPDGSVEGGFTTIAMVAYAKREGLAYPRELEESLRLFKDFEG
jgi:hypothetical protein